MTGYDPKKEIESILKLVPGGWQVRVGRPEYATLSLTVKCEIVDSFFRVVAAGFGNSEIAAARDLFGRWKFGLTTMPFPPPVFSREELELKLAVWGKEKQHALADSFR